MRVLQLIDTLQAGGAETMAVHFANSLSDKIAFSGLVATRFEGQLKSRINPKVSFSCLHKKHALDFVTLFKLQSFIKNNKVQIVHAHGTTFFTAFLLKCICPKIKVIYHEHFGNRVNESFKQNIFLIFCSLFFTEIIVVNLELKTWCEKYLHCKSVTFLPNFASFSHVEKSETFLHGSAGKRIVMVANLKHPKNHLFVLQAFHEMNLSAKGWTLHFIGKIFDDAYSSDIVDFINDNNISNVVFLYGAKLDIQHILYQADIGILASTSEGFPVTILEYAAAKLPTVASNIGYINTIIQNEKSGFLFNPKDSLDFILAVEKCINNHPKSLEYATILYEHCEQLYSEKAVISQLILLYSKNNHE